VLIGPLLTQKRVAETYCDETSGTTTFDFLMQRFGKSYQKSCRNLVYTTGSSYYDELDDGPFGADPTFIPTSTMYRATNNVDDMYGTDERSSTNVPYGFFINQGAANVNFPNEYDDKFPVIFDVNMNRTRANDFVTYLRDGKYLDQQSAFFQLRFVLFNPETSMFVYVDAQCTASSGGGFSFDVDVKTIDAEPCVAFAPPGYGRYAFS
jgi:hypothetical protein